MADAIIKAGWAYPDRKRDRISEIQRGAVFDPHVLVYTVEMKRVVLTPKAVAGKTGIIEYRVIVVAAEIPGLAVEWIIRLQTLVKIYLGLAVIEKR